MITKAIDNRIRKAFSNASIQYDVLTGMHKEIARELVDQIKDLPATAVLDIGMGTGYMTNRLMNYFSNAKVVGIDVSEGMLKEAHKKYDTMPIVCADARALSFRDQQFDLIVSNLAFQWVKPLSKSFEECHRVLKPSGQLSFTLFGQNTFNELFASLEGAFTTFNKPLDIDRLPSENEIKDALTQNGFTGVEIIEERITSHFPDMMTLLQWIKNIGANCLGRNSFVGPDLLAQANKYYENNFKDLPGVKVSFQVYWVTAKKNG